MPRFFVSKDSISDNLAVISGDDAHHISKVLRMKCGEALVLCDQQGNDYHCEISDITDNAVSLTVKECVHCLSEPTVRVTLFMALPKGDKMDYVIQKSIELGASEIVPFSSSRCIVKLSDKDAAKKQERWSRIALEAAKQCGRGIVPKVRKPISFKEMIACASECEMPLFFYEKETNNSLKSRISARTFKSAAVIIGPEGGFSESEVSDVTRAGIPCASLGTRILRCETAPGCAISAIMYETDNI